MEIPGYISARTCRNVQAGGGGEGALKYLCIWELEDGSPLQSQMYREQQEDPTALYLRVSKAIRARTRGLYRQVFPEVGSFEDHSGFHPRHQEISA